ncbi:MAG TPA: hypothetical protein VD905_15480 [Flavobacteriales bacterium]|nr:hypothetical protein [Flavobacteriales bacterium]
MKSLLLNTFLVAMLSVFMVACSKEEVKPFSNGPAGNSSTMQMRDGDDLILGSETADPNASTGGTTEEEVDTDGDGITDGGSSSDYDSKSSKKKKQN